jgi:hypothetical protein
MEHAWFLAIDLSPTLECETTLTYHHNQSILLIALTILIWTN